MKILLLALLLLSPAAQAQYPAKPVRVFVGYAAGSSTDIVGRIMADRLGAHWKQSVYVETRAGAGTTFYLRLPATDAERPSAASPSREARLHG